MFRLCVLFAPSLVTLISEFRVAPLEPAVYVSGTSLMDLGSSSFCMAERSVYPPGPVYVFLVDYVTSAGVYVMVGVGGSELQHAV